MAVGFNHNRYVFFGLFALYGIYAASEGISKHGSAIFQKKRYRDRYRQLFRFSKFFTMLASSLAGLIWVWSGCHFYSDRIC
jgi:hypothetical protein